MIIVWTAGAYAHNQNYHGIGFVLNWPGTSSYVPSAAFDEELAGNVIFTEVLAATAVMIEARAANVIFTESVSKEVVH